MVARGELAVDESFRPILGGDKCKAPRMEFVGGDGMNADLTCPNGNFQVKMTCPDFNVKNGQLDCPQGGLRTTLMRDGKIIAIR